MSFSITGQGTEGSNVGVGTDGCLTDWISIPCATNSNNPSAQSGTPSVCVDRICGMVFNSAASPGGSASVPVSSNKQTQKTTTKQKWHCTRTRRALLYYYLLLFKGDSFVIFLDQMWRGETQHRGSTLTLCQIGTSQIFRNGFKTSTNLLWWFSGSTWCPLLIKLPQIFFFKNCLIFGCLTLAVFTL